MLVGGLVLLKHVFKELEDVPLVDRRCFRRRRRRRRPSRTRTRGLYENVMTQRNASLATIEVEAKNLMCH